MPALSKMLAITISINKNGINKRQPISNAVRNSLMINAGIIICRSISIGLLGGSIRAIFIKRARSVCRLCRSINSLMQSLAFDVAV